MFHQELQIVLFDSKTGKELPHWLRNIPRNDDAIVLGNKLHRVKDVVWHSYESKYKTKTIIHEVRVYLLKEAKK